MSYFRPHHPLLICVMTGMILSGCGGADRPPMGYVTGVVTVDGDPLGGAIVSFKPEVGRAALGVTNEDGTYELKYIHNEKGCKIGPNYVTFSSPTTGTVTHSIPPKYLVQSDLVVDVKRGKNTFDFELESDTTSAKKPPARPRPVID